MKRRNPEQARNELLVAATKLFARRGAERTSLAAVGEEAGGSRGLPADFFGNKENLYQAVFKRASDQVRTRVLAAVQAQPPDAPIDAMLKSLIDSYLDFLDENPQAVRLLQWESLKPAERRLKAPGVLFDDAVGLIEQ